jgi:hypothetical protein
VSTFSRDETERILREAPARLSLHRFEEERAILYPPVLADRFVEGYVDGVRGAALERAVEHRQPRPEGEALAAFAFGWCRGHADLNGYTPRYDRIEEWLSRRGGSGS